MFLRLVKNKAGQTAIEYLLLVAVAITLGVAFYKKMEEYLLTSPNSMIGNQLNTLKNQFNADPTGRYRRYRVPR